MASATMPALATWIAIFVAVVVPAQKAFNTLPFDLLFVSAIVAALVSISLVGLWIVTRMPPELQFLFTAVLWLIVFGMSYVCHLAIIAI